MRWPAVDRRATIKTERGNKRRADTFIFHLLQRPTDYHEICQQQRQRGGKGGGRRHNVSSFLTHNLNIYVLQRNKQTNKQNNSTTPHHQQTNKLINTHTHWKLSIWGSAPHQERRRREADRQDCPTYFRCYASPSPVPPYLTLVQLIPHFFRIHKPLSRAPNEPGELFVKTIALDICT